jgi:hypothetical protein
MPDENKFEKLREIGYSVPTTCGLCVHRNLLVGAHWGTCSLHSYEHKKHTGPARGVSIHVHGTCNDAEADPARTVTLGAHQAFLSK